MKHAAPAARLSTAAALLLVSGAALAGNGYPAFGAPQSLWGELQPVDVGQLPPERDHSSFNGVLQNYRDTALTESLATTNGWVFTADNWGMTVWNAQNPMAPFKPGLGSFGWASFPSQGVGGEEAKEVVKDIAVADGNDGVVALQCDTGTQIGLVIVNTAFKNAPSITYQDTNGDGIEVYAATLGGVTYAFSVGGNAQLARVYNLTEGVKLTPSGPTAYHEAAPDPASLHPTVYVAGTGMGTYLQYISGVEHYVVTGGLHGVEVWDVTSPAAPVDLGGNDSLPVLGGVALWHQGASYYAAGIVQVSGLVYSVQIFDVTQVVANTSKARLDAGPPIATLPTPGYPVPGRSHLTFSRSTDGTPFVQYGGGNMPKGQGLAVIDQTYELLLDVTDPTAPRDVTPKPGMAMGVPATYWGWTYQYGNQLPNVLPSRGRFVGNVLYRAATAIFDLHQWNEPAKGTGGAGGSSSSGSSSGAGGAGHPTMTMSGAGGSAGSGLGGSGAAGMKGGCGCRLAPSEERSSDGWLLAMVAAAGIALARARRPSPKRGAR